MEGLISKHSNGKKRKIKKKGKKRMESNNNNELKKLFLETIEEKIAGEVLEDFLKGKIMTAAEVCKEISSIITHSISFSEEGEEDAEDILDVLEVEAQIDLLSAVYKNDSNIQEARDFYIDLFGDVVDIEFDETEDDEDIDDDELDFSNNDVLPDDDDLSDDDDEESFGADEDDSFENEDDE